MRNLKHYLSFCLVLCLILSSCDEEEPTVSSEPTLDIQSAVISLPGETFTITGLISDPAGIRSIRLKYDTWNLDKNIVLDGGITQYELSYSFKIPDSEVSGSTHTIAIEVLSAGGDMNTG